MSAEIEEVQHEDPGVGTHRVVGFALGFVAFAILLAGGLGLYYRWIVSGEKTNVTVEDFPAPRLQPNPTADWEHFRQAQLEQLQGYRWIDRSKEMVHIPVDRAKALIVARGPKGYDPVEGTPPFLTATGAPLDGAPRATPEPVATPYGNVH